jgi:hypothetical protein
LAVSKQVEHTPENLTRWSEQATALREWTRFMFWPDTQVTVLIDNYRIEMPDGQPPRE